MSYTAIVDYGVGNLKSVSNALTYVGLDNRITGDPQELERANSILLPGVGAFPDAARKLRQTGLDQAILRMGQDKPVLDLPGDAAALCPGRGRGGLFRLGGHPRHGPAHGDLL